MATFLSKLFKPKWQSKNLAVRLEGVAALDANNEQDQRILLDLAQNDSDLRVRSAAIAKLNTSQQLIELHRVASNDLKPLIEQRLLQLASSQSLTLFDLILDPKLLTEMIIKSETPDVFISGLVRIEDQEALATIARHSKTTRIRQAAAELIESEALLSALLASAKTGDKSVYQIVKLKLANLKAQCLEAANRQQLIEKSLQSIEEHARTESTNLYTAKLATLMERWQQLGNDATPEQLARFNAASSVCLAKQQKILDSEQQAKDQERNIQLSESEQQATLSTLAQTLEQCRTQGATAHEIPALDALITTQETRWLEATRKVHVDKAQSKNYQTQMTELKQYLQALKRLDEHTPELEQLIAEVGKSDNPQNRLTELATKISKRLHAIDWPDNLPQPALLANCQVAIGHSAEVKEQYQEHSKELQQNIAKLLELLDQSLEDRQIKQSAKLVKDIQQRLNKMEPKQADKFQQQLSLQVKQLNELRDWQEYASNPRQLALCETMERLSLQSMEPAIKAEKIKALQKEWKVLGGAADQALWTRFKAAADKAYEPCAAFFEEQDLLKAGNLAKRQVLISQLDEFISNNNWAQADWKAVELINQKARLEWKEAFPVEFKANKVPQQQFNELLKKLDQHIEAERSRNLALKTAIVNRAKELIAMEDLEQAITEAKKLQQTWQAIGITEHKQDRSLWNAYRHACDQVFARREQAKEQLREATEAVLQTAETFCAKLEALADRAHELSADELNKTLAEAQVEYQNLPVLPRKQQDHFKARYEAAYKKLKSLIQVTQSQQFFQQWQEIQRKSALCRHLYAEAKFSAQSAIDSAQRAQLEQEFASRLSLPSQLETGLSGLWQALESNTLPKTSVIDLNAARELCIHCEIAAGIDSPEADKPLRMQLQMNRLAGGLTSASEQLSREDQLQKLLTHWYQQVGLTDEQFALFEQRIKVAQDHLFGTSTTTLLT